MNTELKKLEERYIAHISTVSNVMHLYSKEYALEICYKEDIKKWVWGTLWYKKKQIWSTGEFARHDQLTTEQLINLLDKYIEKKVQLSLF